MRIMCIKERRRRCQEASRRRRKPTIRIRLTESNWDVVVSANANASSVRKNVNGLFAVVLGAVSPLQLSFPSSFHRPCCREKGRCAEEGRRSGGWSAMEKRGRGLGGDGAWQRQQQPEAASTEAAEKHSRKEFFPLSVRSQPPQSIRHQQQKLILHLCPRGSGLARSRPLTRPH